MNWYQCFGKWRLEWLMEDKQDLLESNGKPNLQKEQDTQKANISIGGTETKIQIEKVTPEKQKLAVDSFFKH